MKITAVRNRLMRVERQNWHFVEVETDEGLVGVGEASVEWRERAVAAAVDELSRMLIGEDPNLIEHHWQRMHRHGFWRGGVILGSAISGIDQALWDLKGKRLGVPVYDLLGGPTRQRVRLYTHVHGAVDGRPRTRLVRQAQHATGRVRGALPSPERGRRGRVIPSRRVSTKLRAIQS